MKNLQKAGILLLIIICYEIVEFQVPIFSRNLFSLVLLCCILSEYCHSALTRIRGNVRTPAKFKFFITCSTCVREFQFHFRIGDFFAICLYFSLHHAPILNFDDLRFQCKIKSCNTTSSFRHHYMYL